MAEANEKKSSGKAAAIGKRAKISKAQRNMFIAISLASIVFGITLVGVVYLARVIKFNKAVMDEKKVALEQIKSVQENLNNLSNDVEALSENEYLEAVARQRSKLCTENDFEYSLAEIQKARICSSLRVIPDSMPSSLNEEAAAASLNQLLYWSNGGTGVNVEFIGLSNAAKIPERLKTAFASGNSGNAFGELTVNPIGINFSLSDSSARIMNSLDMIERSIRPFDVSSFQISWSDDNGTIDLTASYVGYYTNKKSISINNKVLCADGESKKCALKHGEEVGKK